MPMTEKTIVLKMPDWFNIKNYDACESLTLNEWGEQLNHRVNFMEELMVDGALDLEECGSGYLQGDLLNQIRLNGIATLKTYGQEDTPEFKEVERNSLYHKFSKIGTSAILPIATYILAITGSSVQHKVEKIVKGGDKEKANRAYESYNRAPYDVFRSEYPDDDGMFMPNYAWTAIDISLPDKVILDQMKTFLPAYRKALGIEVNTKQPTPENMAKLVKYKTLAICDIRIWQLQNKVTIKNSVLIGALYPDNTMGEVDLKKFNEFTNTVFNEQFVSMLLAS